jgi:hypothetical protein
MRQGKPGSWYHAGMTSQPSNSAESSRPAPLFTEQDVRPVALSAAMGIIVPILLSAAGLLVVLLGAWTNPYFLALACVAAVYSLFLSARIGINRLTHKPVKPGWVAGVIVLTVYLAPATAMIGFVRLFNRFTGVFDKSLANTVNPDMPSSPLLRNIDPTVDNLSALLLWICAPAFVIGCAVFYLEVVALRHRLVEIEGKVFGK